MSIHASCPTCGKRLSPLGFCDECPDPIAEAIRRRDVPARFSTIDDIAEHLERSRAPREPRRAISESGIDSLTDQRIDPQQTGDLS